ncbi:MAG: hypothetical protein QJR08_00210 [Bacillota bacterium]|nr:hypothetical protein [Bacillota bacterium]
MKLLSDIAPAIYLAGAIDLIDPALALGWRRDAAARLAGLGLLAVDPARGPVAGLSPAEIYARNRALLRSCSAVLAEHAFPVPHYGTTVEIEEAARDGLPVVVWTGGLPAPMYLLRLEPRVAIEPDFGRAVLLAAELAMARVGAAAIPAAGA